MKKIDKVWVTACALYVAYFFNYLIKLCPSIVMPQLQAQMGFSASTAGLISSLYFFPYAIMQFFVGGLAKRFSSQRVCFAGLVVCVFGLLLFGFGTNVYALAFGRFLLGLGTSPFFLGMVSYLQRFYSGKDYARVYGYGIFVGNLGSISASAPLGILVGKFGIPVVFIAISAIALLLGCVLLFLSIAAKDYGVKEKGQNPLGKLWSTLKLILSTPVLTAGLILWCTQSMCLMSYQGLWCVKWTSLAFPTVASYAGLSGVFIGLGVVSSGILSDKWKIYGTFFRKDRGRAETLYVGGWLCALSVVVAVLTKLLPSSPLALIVSLFFDVLYGYAGGSVIVHGGAYVKECAEENNAEIIGVYNGVGCFVQQLSQWGTGVGIDFFLLYNTQEKAFSYTFLSLALIVGLCAFATRRALVGKKA